MSIRFKVTFELLHPYESASYEVCSLNGPNKAIVIATRKHGKVGKGDILSVQVTDLPGGKPEGTDLVDRMEW
mgnify:CR=1 FL=1